MKTKIVGLSLGFACALAPAVAGGEPAEVRDSTPFTAGRDGHACYRCPTLAVGAKGTVLAFCEGRVNGHKDEDDMDVVLRRSTDGGRTWRPLQVLADDGRNPCKNPCPVVLSSGRILLVWLWNRWIPSEKDRTTRRVFVMHSDDEGATWSEPRDITAQVYREDWGWYGTGPCHGIVKRSEPRKGRIIVPARHNTARTPMFTHVIFSDDGGETWEIGGSVPRARTSEATAVELGNGDLMLNMRNQNDDEDCRVVSVSRDGGASFAEAWLDPQLVEPRGCQASLLYHSPNPRTGKGNILFSNPANRATRADGTLKLSEDDGRTWARAFRYAKKPAPNFTGYSDLAVMPDGSVGILHERGDLDDAAKKSERYDEVGFTVVPFEAIRTPLATGPGTPPRHRIDARTPQGLRALFDPAGGALPVVSAHRGGAAEGIPENSLAAFSNTLSRTWAVMEVDPRYTKDGQVVLHHDPTLDRTTTGRGPLADRTLAELKELRLKDPDGNVTDERIPTLDEALEWARGRTVLILDRKDVPLEARVRKIAEHKAEAHAMVIVYSFDEARACHALNPDIMMEVMIPSAAKAAEFERTGVPWSHVVAFVGHTPPEDPALAGLIRAKGARCIAGTSRNLDRKYVSSAPDALAAVEAEYRALLRQGVDLIETDIPSLLGPLLHGATPVPESMKPFLRRAP